ncbi:MAG TPA: signal peptidase II, partial [Acidothermaceae bacterium]
AVCVMQTTRGTSLDDEGEARGTSVEPSIEPGAAAAPGRHRAQGVAAVDTGTPRRRHLGVLFAVAAFVLVADVVSKVIVVAKLSGRAPVRLLHGFLTLDYTRNAGAAFSIGTGATYLFGIVAIAVILVILRTARRLFSTPWAIVLGLLLGGATGNLIDRLVRSPGVLRGHVVDWIQLPHFAVFNLADSAISVGGVLAVLLALAGRQLDGTIARSSRAGHRDAAPVGTVLPDESDS